MSAQDRIRVGVVGVGVLGSHHTRIYSSLPQAKLVGVVDPVPERRRELASRYGCRSWPDHGPLLDRVDAVSVAVPTSLHAEVALPFLRRGIHVLVEKPIAEDLESATRMVDEARGAVLHVGHSERFNPAVLAIRPFVKTPRFFEVHRLSVLTPRSLDVDVVLDLMIHDLDLITQMVRSPIREIRAVGIPVLTPRIDIANARLEFEDGCVANLTSSRVSKQKMRKLRFFQADDYISLDLDRQVAEISSMVEVNGSRRIVNRSPQVAPEEPLKMEIAAFLEEIAGRHGQGREFGPGCSGGEGVRVLDLALEILDRMTVAGQQGSSISGPTR